jgi:hypothetical protein
VFALPDVSGEPRNGAYASFQLDPDDVDVDVLMWRRATNETGLI